MRIQILAIAGLLGFTSSSIAKPLQNEYSSEIAQTIANEISESARVRFSSVDLVLEFSGTDYGSSMADAIKNAFGKLGFRCHSKEELLDLMKRSQMAAIQQNDPTAFLAAEDQYGWDCILKSNITVNERMNTFLGINVITVRGKFSLYSADNKTLAFVDFEPQMHGDDKDVAAANALLQSADYLAASIARDYAKTFR